MCKGTATVCAADTAGEATAGAAVAATAAEKGPRGGRRAAAAGTEAVPIAASVVEATPVGNCGCDGEGETEETLPPPLTAATAPTAVWWALGKDGAKWEADLLGLGFDAKNGGCCSAALARASRASSSARSASMCGL